MKRGMSSSYTASSEYGPFSTSERLFDLLSTVPLHLTNLKRPMGPAFSGAK
jgi:hypothetical protein